MKIFILEDNPDRMIAFKSILKDHTIIHAIDVKEAKEKFDKNRPFDSILLDHDLGGEIYVDSDFWNTGYNLLDFLLRIDLRILKTHKSLFIHKILLVQKICFSYLYKKIFKQK